MPAIEINLTIEQLAMAYEQLSQHERQTFLKTVLTLPDNQQITIDMLAKLQATLRRQSPSAKQKNRLALR